MRCPVDGTTLTLAERAGVEIDYCPRCRGLWLDRGELDRIIDRTDTGDNRESAYDDHRERVEHGQHREDDNWQRWDQDRYGDTGHGPSRRNRPGAFGALADLLGGGDD